MMHYLGQPIELMQESPGWVGIWWHTAGYRIEMGFFPTAAAAWDAMAELVRRDLAVRSLLEVVEAWKDETRISDCEYELTTETLVQSVLV